MDGPRRRVVVFATPAGIPIGRDKETRPANTLGKGRISLPYVQHWGVFITAEKGSPENCQVDGVFFELRPNHNTRSLECFQRSRQQREEQEKNNGKWIKWIDSYHTTSLTDEQIKALGEFICKNQMPDYSVTQANCQIFVNILANRIVDGEWRPYRTLRDAFGLKPNEKLLWFAHESEMTAPMPFRSEKPVTQPSSERPSVEDRSKTEPLANATATRPTLPEMLDRAQRRPTFSEPLEDFKTNSLLRASQPDTVSVRPEPVQKSPPYIRLIRDGYFELHFISVHGQPLMPIQGLAKQLSVKLAIPAIPFLPKGVPGRVDLPYNMKHFTKCLVALQGDGVSVRMIVYFTKPGRDPPTNLWRLLSGALDIDDCELKRDEPEAYSIGFGWIAEKHYHKDRQWCVTLSWRPQRFFPRKDLSQIKIPNDKSLPPIPSNASAQAPIPVPQTGVQTVAQSPASFSLQQVSATVISIAPKSNSPASVPSRRPVSSKEPSAGASNTLAGHGSASGLLRGPLNVQTGARSFNQPQLIGRPPHDSRPAPALPQATLPGPRCTRASGSGPNVHLRAAPNTQMSGPNGATTTSRWSMRQNGGASISGTPPAIQTHPQVGTLMPDNLLGSRQKPLHGYPKAMPMKRFSAHSYSNGTLPAHSANAHTAGHNVSGSTKQSDNSDGFIPFPHYAGDRSRDTYHAHTGQERTGTKLAGYGAVTGLVGAGACAVLSHEFNSEEPLVQHQQFGQLEPNDDYSDEYTTREPDLTADMDDDILSGVFESPEEHSAYEENNHNAWAEEPSERSPTDEHNHQTNSCDQEENDEDELVYHGRGRALSEVSSVHSASAPPEVSVDTNRDDGSSSDSNSGDSDESDNTTENDAESDNESDEHIEHNEHDEDDEDDDDAYVTEVSDEGSESDESHSDGSSDSSDDEGEQENTMIDEHETPSYRSSAQSEAYEHQLDGHVGEQHVEQYTEGYDDYHGGMATEADGYHDVHSGESDEEYDEAQHDKHTIQTYGTHYQGQDHEQYDQPYDTNYQATHGLHFYEPDNAEEADEYSDHYQEHYGQQYQGHHEQQHSENYQEQHEEEGYAQDDDEYSEQYDYD